MILIDIPRSYDGKGKFSHLVASSIPELHEFAQSVGIKKCWFSNKKGKFQPHYDIHQHEFIKCVESGAKIVLRKELTVFLKENYGR